MTIYAATPPRLPGTVARIVATNDLLGSVAALRTTTGRSGTVDGVAALVAGERASGPTLWLDSGDLIGGPLWSLTGQRDWSLFADLGIDAMALGNHELDEGIERMLEGQAKLEFPLLCANADTGLPAICLIEKGPATIGVIGLTSPYVDRLSPFRGAMHQATSRVLAAAHQLRAQGAQWVIVLQHDGVDWWPSPGGIGVSPQRWADSTHQWQDSVTAVLGGHTLGAWHGYVGQTMYGHAHPFASTALVVDLTPEGANTRGLVKIPANIEPSRSRTAAAELILTAEQDIVGGNLESLTTAHGSPPNHYLPDIVAKAIRQAAGAESAFLPSNGFFTQAPIDGAVAALPSGPVSRLDLHRLFPFPDDEILIAEIAAHEFDHITKTHNRLTDPAHRAGDHQWWNWHRTRAGLSTSKEHPSTVAITQFSLPIIEGWVGRRLDIVHGTKGREALEAWFAR